MDRVRNYHLLYENGELEKIIEKAYQIMSRCRICPRGCGVNRFNENEINKSFCKSSSLPKVASYHVHFGEEPPLVGSDGSGTIFFSNCSLRCAYCQNYPISQLRQGKEITEKELAQIILLLQKKGCENINFVTPTHFVPQILKALFYAIGEGLNLPLVYNSSGYESYETLSNLLDGVIDIYLPDMRYGSDEMAKKYSSAPNYLEINRLAVKEMFRQVGNLELDERGVAIKGLIIRHLVLPNQISETEKILSFITEEISNETYISLMNQYFPAYRAHEFKELERKLTRKEYKRAFKLMDKNNLYQGFYQEST